MRNILILFLLLNSASLLAQPGVAPKKEIDGKTYYVHKVVSGNTLWGLQQMYGVKVDDIMAVNPELSDGLKTGQDVLIPVSDYAQPVEEEKTSEYKVRRGETLYGLSRKFDTTVDELIRLNPVLRDKGLEKGQIIIVPGEVGEEEPQEVVEDPREEPVPNPFVVDTTETNGQEEVTIVSFSDSTIRHEVMAHETMYKISKRFMVPIEEIMKINNLTSTSLREGQVLIIPVKQERIEKVVIKQVPEAYDPDSNEPIEFDEKERYKVAMILPFHLDYGSSYSSQVSNLATQFYMGALLALDSLKAMGLNADIYFYDSKNDSAHVVSLLNKPDFADVDLVIGPFYPKTQRIVAEHCRNNKIRMVSPIPSNASLLEDNRLVYASVPSDLTMMRKLAEHILNHNTSDKIILVKPNKESDMPYYEAFRKSFKESPVVQGARPNLIETSIDGVKTYLTTKQKNIVVIPSKNKFTASKYLNTLDKSTFRAGKNNIYVYGMKEWLEYDQVSNYNKNKFNFRFASPNFIDYYGDEAVTLNKEFRSRYNTDMSKMAVQGYDITMFYCAAFFLEDAQPTLLMNNFSLNQVSDMDGYESDNIFVIEQEDYELINVTGL